MPSSISYLQNYAIEHHVPIIKQGALLHLLELVNEIKPKVVLELGTAIGYSSIMIASRMNGGYIDTIEISAEMVALALQNTRESNVPINIIHGDAVEILREWNNTKDKKYDLIFIDASKGHYTEFFLMSKNLLAKDGVIFFDNVDFRGMVDGDVPVPRRKKTIVKRMREFKEVIANDEDFVTEIRHVDDGIAISRRTK